MKNFGIYFLSLKEKSQIIVWLTSCINFIHIHLDLEKIVTVSTCPSFKTPQSPLHISIMPPILNRVKNPIFLLPLRMPTVQAKRLISLVAPVDHACTERFLSHESALEIIACTTVLKIIAYIWRAKSSKKLLTLYNTFLVLEMLIWIIILLLYNTMWAVIILDWLTIILILYNNNYNN